MLTLHSLDGLGIALLLSAGLFLAAWLKASHDAPTLQALDLRSDRYHASRAALARGRTTQTLRRMAREMRKG